MSALLDGRPCDQLSVLDRGLHYGDGLFETIACPAGRPRLLGRHLRRLTGGCLRLGIAPPDAAMLAGEVTTLAAGAERCVVKVIVTRGVARARGYASRGTATPTRLVLRYPWDPEDPALARDGVRVRTGSLRLGENPLLAGLKHLNRLEQVLARREWDDAEIADSLLYCSSGTLVSGTMSNVFLVVDGTLLTPRLDRCGVAGVLRALVLELAARNGMSCVESTIDPATVGRAGELFLTSALTGIRPVRELDGEARNVGPVTRVLQARLASHFEADAAGAQVDDA